MVISFAVSLGGSPFVDIGYLHDSRWIHAFPALGAASVIRAVEYQALIAVMAERAGVRVPSVYRVNQADGGTARLAMEQIEGRSLGQFPAQQISDDLRQRLWADVDRLHRAGIAPVPADGRRDGRERRAAMADRLQLLRAGRHPL